MNCKNCKKQGCSLSGRNHEMSFECKAYVGKTNADRIRAMWDIELGNFLSGLILGCSDCPMYEECDGVNCNSRWQKWLKEEAKDD